MDGQTAAHRGSISMLVMELGMYHATMPPQLTLKAIAEPETAGLVLGLRISGTGEAVSMTDSSSLSLVFPTAYLNIELTEVLCTDASAPVPTLTHFFKSTGGAAKREL